MARLDVGQDGKARVADEAARGRGDACAGYRCAR
jgi:hypothetical protein